MAAVLDQQGEEVWSDQYAGETGAGATTTDLVITNDGRVIISGYEESPAGTNGTVLAYSFEGEELWQISYDAGNDLDDRFNAIAVNGYGDVIATGMASTEPSGSQYVTVQFGNAVGIPEMDGSAVLQISPSLVRAGGPIAIHIPIDGVASIQITDASGRVVEESSFTRNLNWIATATGIYNVRAITEEGRSFGRFVVY